MAFQQPPPTGVPTGPLATPGTAAAAPATTPAASASASASAVRGRTLFPLARDFLGGLRNIAEYGPSKRTLDGNKFKQMYFDNKCEIDFISLFDGTERNAQHRQSLMSGQVPGVQAIDQHRIATILKFSDEYDLNELSCLDYYISTQRNPSILQKLEASDPLKKAGYYDLKDRGRVEEAPRDLYHYERTTMLDGLLLLMKMYVETKRIQQEEEDALPSTDDSSYEAVITMGDTLLNQKKLTSKLISTMKKRYESLRQRNVEGQKSLGQGREYFISKLDQQDFEELQKLSTILFYSMEFYDNAAQDLQALQDLIFLLSKDLTKNNDFLLSVDGAETINAWQAPAHVTLVVLQLTHFQAVDGLTDRCFEAHQDGEPEIKALLFKLAGKLYAESNGVGCHSAYGMALLAYAQFTHEAGPPPRNMNNSQGDGAAPPPDFLDLMHQVNEGDACLGTYNYLRLCVLPVLQAQSHDAKSKDTCIGGMSETHSNFFSSFLKLLDALACTCLDSFDRFGDATVSDIGNLFAATYAVKPTYAKQFNPNATIPHGAFDPFAVQLLNNTMHVAGGKLNAVSLYLLSGLCGGPQEAENVYRLLDSTPEAANPNAISKLNWGVILAFVQKCVDYVSKIQDIHEKILVAVFTLMSSVAGRSPMVAISMLRDYRPIPLLFQLLAVPVSITLKGSIYRALSAMARVDAREVHDELWALIESYRLLPTYGIGKDASTAMSGVLGVSGGVGVSVSNNVTGLRLELEDSESKEGLYSITDGFLQLLDTLLSHGAQDQLGSRYRPPGIVVYLEYVMEDVLIKAKDRFFTVGPQGRAQRWRLVARCFKVLTHVLQHYPINALEMLQSQKAKGEAIDEDVLSSLEVDFREESVSYTINGTLHHDQPRLKSAGFFIMALLLSNTSRLRDQLLQILAECGLSNLLDAWSKNFEAATKQALKMGEILAQKTKQNSFLDNRLSFYGFEGGICDGSYWQGRSVTTAMGLLYECALREKAFVKHFRSAPYLTILRHEQGRLVSTPVAVHNLADILSVNASAMCNILKLLNIPDYMSTSIPSVPIMATKILKKAATDLTSTKLLDTINGQLAHARNVEGGSMADNFLELQNCCLEAMIDTNRLPIMESYEQGIMALGSDITTDVYSLDTMPYSPPDAEHVLKEAHTLLENGTSLENSEFETKPEGVVDFLLTTLSANNECLSHMLLGLMDCLDETRVNRWDLRLASDNWKRAEIPTNVLEQILLRVEDTTDLLKKDPELACICFELIYRLCANPITSAITLAFLRKYDVVDADGNAEKLLGCCMRQCVDVLTEKQDQDKFDDEGESHKWYKIKTSRSICCGWLLKTCALELRSLGILRDSGTLLPLHLEPFMDLYNEDIPYSGFNMNFLEIILLSSCDGEDVAPENISPLVSMCLSAASTQYHIGRFDGAQSSRGQNSTESSSTSGGGSFTVIDKRGFIKQFFSEVDETEFQDKADEYRQGIQLLVRLNKRYRELAASVHLSEAWKQYTSVFVICHNSAIISRAPDRSTQDLQDYMSSLLLPILRNLREKAPKLNLAVLENISSTLFILVRELGRLPKRGIQGKPLRLFSHAILTEQDLTALLDDLVAVILQSVTGFLQPQGESVKFRGFLYSTLTSVLTCLAAFPSSLNTKMQLVSDNKYKAEHSGSNSRDAAIRATTICILEKHASELTDAIGRDCCTGPLLWRLNAFTALSNIMAILGQSGIRSVLQVLLAHGYLHQMLSVIDTFKDDGSASLRENTAFQTESSGNTDAREARAQRETFVSVISLCKHIASTPEGTEALLQSGGILRRLHESPIFKRTPHNLDSLSVLQLEEGYIPTWVTQLLPVLRLLRVLAVNSPSRQVLLGIADFLRGNQESVVFILRLRLKSLAGLVLAECVTSLLATVASASPSMNRTDSAEGSSGSSSHLWDTAFGSFGDSILGDLCDLLRLIGGDPFPKELARKCGVSSVGAFWSHVMPSALRTGWVEDEGRLADTVIYNGEEFKEFPRKWTAFDHTKLELSLKIASNIAALLRLRTHAVIEQGFSRNRSVVTVGSSGSGGNGQNMNAAAGAAGAGTTSMESIDLSSVAQAFCQCSALSRKCAGPSVSADRQQQHHQRTHIGTQAYTEEKVYGAPGTIMQGVQATLLYISENLITTLHDMHMAAGQGSWKEGALETILSEAQIPGEGNSRQFINELGRVMRYKSGVM